MKTACRLLLFSLPIESKKIAEMDREFKKHASTVLTFVVKHEMLQVEFIKSPVQMEQALCAII